MKTVVILGAGQMGRAVADLLAADRLRLLAYGDNNPDAWTGPVRDGAPVGWAGQAPVLPVEEAVGLAPDLLLFGVADDERAGALREQALAAGFAGEFLGLGELTARFDIRAATLYRIARRLRERKVPGAVAELGVFRGDTAWKLNALFPDRTLYLFDTFAGFPEADLKTEAELGCSRAARAEFAGTSVEAVLARLPHPERAAVRRGYFPDTAVRLEEHFCLVSLDADLYAPTLAGLEYFLPRLAPGGMIILHDYGNTRFDGVRRAVADYEAAHAPLLLVPLSDLHGSAVILRAEMSESMDPVTNTWTEE